MNPTTIATATTINKAWFEASVCRNCGAAQTEKFCPACGQAKQKRIGIRHLFEELWQLIRIFEKRTVEAGIQLLQYPGFTARAYLMGARKRNYHPFSILLLMIGIMIVLLNKTNYMEVVNPPNAAAAVQAVKKFANYTFSIGIPLSALLIWMFFYQRNGYNFVELLFLGIYIQAVILICKIIFFLPLLIWHKPNHILGHYEFSSKIGMYVDGAVLLVVIWQFFGIRTRLDWLRLILLITAYILAKKYVLLGVVHFILYLTQHKIL
jgi:hypothetical protein